MYVDPAAYTQAQHHVCRHDSTQAKYYFFYLLLHPVVITCLVSVDWMRRAVPRSRLPHGLDELLGACG